ncbi:LysR family transcriptional regulator [Maritimibacter sp. DP07]|uniref:LysR family transcriptional regulator n=1 Tax=Maritimibacter harenae TaxID=2606218 RepID=A0A845M3Y7_9RHOB|nr:LysR family transcriptional regulator [Maritimibacter harenae]MZR13709.1 LysR family transcriptional regulator [Maritimibacter harenae]
MRNLNSLDLNLLKVFDAIYRERSVSIASERLNMTQPATSNALNRLRHALDDQLFVRTRNGMEPTLFAQSIAASVQRGLREITESILQGLWFDPTETPRRFTILATDVGEETYIAELVRRLEREAPFIDIRVLEAPLDEYETLLEFGYADLAIGRLTLPEKFMQEKIAACGYAIVMCENHAKALGLSDGETMPYDVYMQQRHLHVLPRATGAKHHPVDIALGIEGQNRRIAVTLPHTSVLSEILPGTSLVATVPTPGVAPMKGRARLVRLELPYETERLDILLVWHRRHQLDKGHAWLREQVRALPMSDWNTMQQSNS